MVKCKTKPLTIEEAKKFVKPEKYIWIRASYFLFGEKLYHLRVFSVGDDGIWIDHITSNYALSWRGYGRCWEIYRTKRDGNPD